MLPSVVNYQLCCYVTILNTFMSHRTQKLETLGIPNNVPDSRKELFTLLLTLLWPHWLSARPFILGGANER